MGQIITKPFAWLMVKLYELTGNYGVAIILFALCVNLILSPFMAKSKKSMMRTSRIQPRINELQRKHEGNQQKLQEEMSKLYREEGINPMSGCIWSLIPFPILIALYSVIRQPITKMMWAAQSVVDNLQELLVSNGLYEIPAKADAYLEIRLANIAHNNWDLITPELGDKLAGLMDLDFSFLGLNLGTQPSWKAPFTTDYSDPSVWLPAIGLFLIPFISAGLTWLTSKVATMNNPQQQGNDQAAATMQSMNIMMPLMSIWICFIMPAAMGIYWIANSVFGMTRDYFLTKYYSKKIDEEDAIRQAQRSEREKELEAKRLETERLRAEGKTEQNANTSKKKIQASQKQKSDERKAALDREERAKRREMLGIAEAEKPASQVGNRRYARGRAYVPDRFSNPETAEEETLKAALLSEDDSSIDETVEDEVIAVAEEIAEEVVEAAGEAVEESSGENA